MKQNNKSSFTGIMLMAAILIIFNLFFFNNSEEISDSSKKDEPKDENNLSNENNTEYITDSTKIVEEFYTLENDKIKLIFTNKGGEIKSAIVKNYYSYQEYKKSLDDKIVLKDSNAIEIFNNNDSKLKITDYNNILVDFKYKL